MFKPTLDTPFVCLGDVYGKYIEINPVIWNPCIRREENENVLHEITKKYFEVDLSNEVLSRLSASKDARNFVQEFKKVI